MASHLAGFYSNINAPNLATITPIIDPQLKRSANYLTVPDLNLINCAWIVGDTISQAQISSPSLKDVGLEDVPNFVDDTVLPISQAVNEGGGATYVIHRSGWLNDYFDNPITMKAAEQMSVLIKNTAINDAFAFLLFSDKQLLAPVKGKIRTLHGTFPATTGTKAWELGEITLDQELPEGKYSIVGGVIFASNILAARFSPISAGYKPGFPVQYSRAPEYATRFRKGMLGSMLDFTDTTLPNLETVSIGASVGNEIFLDLIKTG